VRINVALWHVHVTIVTNGKALIITYSGCVSVALVTQHVTRMHPITLTSVLCPDVHFPHYLIKQHNYLSKVTEHKMHFDFL